MGPLSFLRALVKAILNRILRSWIQGRFRGPQGSRNVRKVVFSWFSGGSFFKNKLEKLLRFIFVLTIGKSFLNDSKSAQNSQKKREKLLKFMTLTIGKLFLEDFKRAQISRKKLEKLLKFMTLTIGKWFLDDFKRVHFPPKNTWETSQIFSMLWAMNSN